jgi:hypothetical protein
MAYVFKRGESYSFSVCAHVAERFIRWVRLSFALRVETRQRPSKMLTVLLQTQGTRPIRQSKCSNAIRADHDSDNRELPDHGSDRETFLRSRFELC